MGLILKLLLRLWLPFQVPSFLLFGFHIGNFKLSKKALFSSWLISSSVVLKINTFVYLSVCMLLACQNHKHLLLHSSKYRLLKEKSVELALWLYVV